jgi:hypothetical protein
VTQALPRTRPSTVAPPAAASGVAPLWVRGAFAAVWTVTVGVAGLVVVVLAMWAADARSQASAGVATRFALVVWLASMHVPMHVASGGTVALAPLVLTLALVLLLARAASIVARGQQCASARELGTVVGVVVGPYVALCVAIAILARSAQVTPSLPGTVVAALITGMLATGAGVLRGSGSGRTWWARLPADLRAGLGAAAAGLAVLLGVAALLLVGSLALHTEALRASLTHFGGGLPVEASVAVLCLVLLPNAVVCALGYLAGPGFALGAGSSYSLGGVHAAPVPSLPVLAGRPLGAAPASVAVLCIVAIVLAGGVTGWRLARRPGTGLMTGLRQVAVAGAAAGVVTAVLVAVAGGPAGPGALSAVGASPWQVGLSVAGELMLPAAVVVLAWIWLVRLPTVAALPGRGRQLIARLKR